MMKDAWSSLRSSTISWSYMPNCHRLPIHGVTQFLLLRSPLLLLALLARNWYRVKSMRSCWCWRTASRYSRLRLSLAGSSISRMTWASTHHGVLRSSLLTGSSCEPHFYIPIPLNAANTPLYGSCKLEKRSVSSVAVRNTSNTSTYVNMRWG